MKSVLSSALIFLCIVPVFADNSREGYVLRANEGEEVFEGTRVKASPELGTRAIEVIIWANPTGFSTGLHYHLEADEYFFIVSGSGVVTIGDNTYDSG